VKITLKLYHNPEKKKSLFAVSRHFVKVDRKNRRRFVGFRLFLRAFAQNGCALPDQNLQ
jgi:hypothetical protein